MAACHIEYINLSASELPSEINEYMEVNSSICVQFAPNDALGCQSRKMTNNLMWVEVSTLAVRNEGIACVDNELRHEVRQKSRGVREVLGETNIIAQDTGHTPHYIASARGTISPRRTKVMPTPTQINPSTETQTNTDHGVPTKVWFVQGKKNNKAFRTALSLLREDATLSENKENIPPKDDVKESSAQRDEYQKA